MTVDETLARLKALYFETTPQTIGAAFDEAIDLMKALPSDDDRARAAVYMEGLAEMRQEFAGGRGGSRGGRPGGRGGPRPPRR